MSPLDVFSEPVWQRLTWTLLHFLWQGLAVAALLVTVLWLFRVRQARIRYAVSLLAMLVMVACPLVTFAVMEVGADARAEVGRGTAAVEREAAERRPTIVQQEPDTADEAVVLHQPVELGEDVFLHDPQVVDRPVAAEATEPRRSLRLSGYARTVQPYLMLGWIAGVSLLGARLLLAQVGVQWLRRRRRPISAELVSCVARLRKRLGLRSVPRVSGCERIGEAIVVGLLRPMVLLPACWLTEMTPEVLEAVIAHELAHIRRWDLWVNLLQRLVETLLFYQPAVWWVSRRVRLEREMCCDELAVGATGQPMAYATALSQAARKRAVRTKPMLGAAMGGTEMTLLSRVRYVLGFAPGRERARWWPVGLLALLVPLLIWSASTGVVRPDPGEAQAEEGEERGSGSALKVGFDTVSVSFSDPMSRQAPEHIEISADGSCVYKIEGVPARGRVKERPPARQTCRIGDKRLQQLEGMLKKTDWLTAPGGELPAPPGMGGGEITLVRKGQTRSIICHHRAPEPYRPLIWFFRGVARQENLLYQLRWESVAQRLSAFNEIRSGTEALEGRWGRGYPFYDLDYSRYLPTFREVLRKPENRHPEEIAAAVRLVAFLRVESEFEPIAKLAHHSEGNVRTQVARALTDFGGARAVPVLAEMAPKTHEAVWGLIRLGDIAVPTIVEMILETASYDDKALSNRMVRGYLRHWNELPRPVDQRVVAAARQAAPDPKPYRFGEYHGVFLETVKSRPVPAGELSCRIERDVVYCPQPMRFIHGWYTAADGKIVEHGALAAPEPGMKVFGLKFEAGIEGGRLVIRGTSGLTRGPSGEQPQPVVAESHIDVPRGTQLEVVYQYRLDKAKMTSSPCPLRVSTGYRTLWEGRLVKDGQTLKRIVYAARVAEPTDPAGEFKPPSAPAPTLAEPERPPRKVTFRGMDLTNASELSNHRIRHDLAMAERNHAIKAEGGTVTEQTQTVVIYKTPSKKAPSRQFVVFHDPKQQIFYIEVIFREVGKRLEIVVYGPLRGDPFEKLGLPAPPGKSEARAEGKDVPTATAAGEPYRIRPFDLLTIKALGTFPDYPIDRVCLVEPSGQVGLGPSYGRAQLKGLTLEEAESAIEKQLRQVLREPKVQVTTAGRVTRWRRAVLPKAPYRIRPNDSVGIRVSGTLPDHPIDGPYAVEPSGQVPLGPKYGRARLGGLTLEEAEDALEAHLDKWLREPKASVTMKGWKSAWRDSSVPGPSYRIRMAPGELLDIHVVGTLVNEPIRGILLVEPSGKVALGPSYGRVRVEGLTVQEAQTAIEEHLKKMLRDPHVSVSPAGWRGEEEPSKKPGVRPDEQNAVAALTKRGARVERDATGIVKTVSFSNTRATDADLLHLKGLANLRCLDLHSASEDYAGFNRVNVTGAGLAHLGGLAKLEELNLLGTTDTDAALAHLNRLTKLKSLDLGYTKVTDAGLAHLGKLTGLESLSLEAAHEITDAGLLHLRGLAKLEHLRLDYTTIGDGGLKHLKPLAGLQSLHLSGTKVTDAGVEHLAEMGALRVLQVRRTQITAVGLKKLQEALPNAEILADSGRPMSVPTKEREPGGQRAGDPSEDSRSAPRENGTLAGRVLDAQGAPVANAYVLLFDQTSGIPLSRRFHLVSRELAEGLKDIEQADLLAHVRSDEQGRFRFQDVPAGEYRVVAQSWKDAQPVDDLLSMVSSEIHLHGIADHVRVSSGSTREVVLRPLGTGVLRIDDNTADFAEYYKDYVHDGLKKPGSVLVISTSPLRADPILGFPAWGGQFARGLIGASIKAPGKATVYGLPEGKIYVGLGVYSDEDSGFGAGEAEIRPKTTTNVRIRIMARWAKGHFLPPKRLMPLAQAIEHFSREFSGGEFRAYRYVQVTMNANGISFGPQRGDYVLHYWREIARLMDREVGLPTGGKAKFADVMAAYSYVNLAQRQQKRAKRQGKGPPEP